MNVLYSLASARSRNTGISIITNSGHRLTVSYAGTGLWTVRHLSPNKDKSYLGTWEQVVLFILRLGDMVKVTKVPLTNDNKIRYPMA